MPEPRDCDAVIVGTGPAGATAADVLTSAGWSVIMLEKGRNHLLSLEAPFAGLGHVVERRDQVAAPPLPRPRSVPRAAHATGATTATATACSRAR